MLIITETNHKRLAFTTKPLTKYRSNYACMQRTGGPGAIVRIFIQQFNKANMVSMRSTDWLDSWWRSYHKTPKKKCVCAMCEWRPTSKHYIHWRMNGVVLSCLCRYNKFMSNNTDKTSCLHARLVCKVNKTERCLVVAIILIRSNQPGLGWDRQIHIFLYENSFQKEKVTVAFY